MSFETHTAKNPGYDHDFAALRDVGHSHDVILVCPHLGDGGVQRVISTLANEWDRQGRHVAVIALYRDEMSYELNPGICYVPLCDTRNSSRLLWMVEEVRILVDQVRTRIKLLIGSMLQIWDRIWTALSGLRLARFLSQLKLPRFLSPLNLLRPIWEFLKLVCWTWPRRLLRALLRSLLRLSERTANHLGIRGLWRLYPPILIRVLALRGAIRTLNAKAVIGFCGSTAIATVLAAKSLKPRIIISERNDPARQALAFPWNDLRPVYYRDADLVTANTQGALTTMSRYVPMKKLTLVPNPVGTHELSAEIRRHQGASPTVLIVARLHPQKAHDSLLRAFALLPRALSRWRLSIVGRGQTEAPLRELAATLGISSRVDWYGQVPDPYLYYQQADIFALPSRHEGMPNALLEAMSCGLPVIVTDASPGPLELVENRRTGLVVPVDDPAALGDAISTLARDPELASKLGKAARKRVAGNTLQEILSTWEGHLGW